MLEPINGIPDLSKAESGRLLVEKENLPAHRVIADVVRVLAIKAQEIGIGLSFEAATDLPETACSDPAMFRQRVTDLIDNAVKLTEHGGMKEMASSTRLAPVVEEDEGTATPVSRTPFTAAAGGPQTDRLMRSTIMMVDDEPIMMDVVQGFLESVGYRSFITLEDSTTALETIVRYQRDVLLLDLVMPGVSGFDLLTTLRADPCIDHLPVVVLTSSTDA